MYEHLQVLVPILFTRLRYTCTLQLSAGSQDFIVLYVVLLDAILTSFHAESSCIEGHICYQLVK